MFRGRLFSISTHRLPVLDNLFIGFRHFWLIFQRVGPYHTMNYIFVGTSEKGCLEMKLNTMVERCLSRHDYGNLLRHS